MVDVPRRRSGGSGAPNAELIATRWLPLDHAVWSDDIIADQFLYPQLLTLLQSIGYGDARGRPHCAAP